MNLVPKGRANRNAFINAMKNATSTIDDMIPWEGFQTALFNSMEEFKGAMMRGIKIRYITNFSEKHEMNSIVLKNLKELQKIGSFQVRSKKTHPKSVFAIFDKQLVCICTYPIPYPVETPALCSNTRTLLELAQSQFDLQWQKSKKVFE